MPSLVSSTWTKKVPQPPLLHVYSRNPKVPNSIVHMFDPPSLAAGSSHHPLPYDLDLSIVLQKGKCSLLLTLFLTVSYDKLTPFTNLLSLSSISIPRLYQEAVLVSI